MKLKAWQGDVILGIVSIVIGIVIIILNNMQGLQLMKNGQPGPGMFPVICAVAVMICGALLLLEVRARIRKQQQTGKEDPDVEGNVINIKELRTVALEALESCQKQRETDWASIKSTIKSDLSGFLYKKTKRNPMILPVIMEV